MPPSEPEIPSIGRDEIVRLSPYNAEAPGGALHLPVTPIGSAYVRTNFGIPERRPRCVTLRDVRGAEHALDLDDLRAMGGVTMAVTLECAGNDRVSMVPLPPGETWRGNAVSTAEWTGVPLARVLSTFDVARDACELLFTGADAGPRDGREIAFQRALATERAMSDGPLLAYAMNGGEIPAQHGGFVRLVVPGWYAMASVKWLTRIDALREPFAGHFQTERYVYDVPGEPTEPVREVRVKSTILAPGAGDHVAVDEPVTVRGWAWSGHEITGVDVSFSADEPWYPADLAPAGSRWGWRGWSLAWTPATAGHHVLRCRATDASGARQPDRAAWNSLGYGNNGIRAVSVIVG